MKKLNKVLVLLPLIGLFTSCDIVDFTDVTNPNLPFDQFVDGGNASAWLVGVRRQASLVFSNHTTEVEIASDNYDNTRTFFNQFMDGPTFNSTDADVNTALFAISDLRESAIFGYTDVGPADPNFTTLQESEFLFYESLANVLLGEIYVGFPLAPNGPLATPTELYNQALARINSAIAITARPEYYILQARIYRNLGNATNALSAAQNAITADGGANTLVNAVYDFTNGPGNDLQDALVDRSTFDDLQPLPRLDFLDPKFLNTGTEERPIAIAKIEEAYLIQAEAQVANGDLAAARTTLSSLLTVVANRPVTTRSDQTEGRTQAAPGTRPNLSSVQVRSDATQPYLTGLVLDRAAATVTVPNVSGTSVVAADITAATTEDDLYYIIYLMRQQIFIAEGRRMADLGLKWPISQIEFNSNTSGLPASALTPQIPSFIPLSSGMDAFTYDSGTGLCTVTNDMNRILVTNKADSAVLPFE